VGDIPTLEKDITFGWRFQSGARSQQGRLTTTAWPQERKKLSGLNFKGYIIQGDNVSKPFGDFLEKYNMIQ
jgi:hypothetical protein